MESLQFTITKLSAEEMAQQLGALAALSEALGLSPNTYEAAQSLL